MSAKPIPPLRIAVIGWGSLIWCPGCLRIKTAWRCDGPLLPIEFARISGDKRLTLVIHGGSAEEPTPDQQTYWALSEFENLNAARKNLQAREGATNIDDIPSVTTAGQTEGTVRQGISDRIREWLECHRNVDAATWTNLSSNWPKKRDNKEFTREDAVAYLRELKAEGDQAKAIYERASEYVRNTPSQIQTPVRRMIQKAKSWEDATLPSVLFEKEEGRN